MREIAVPRVNVKYYTAYCRSIVVNVDTLGKKKVSRAKKLTKVIKPTARTVDVVSEILQKPPIAAPMQVR